MKPKSENRNGRPETGADLDDKFQRCQAAYVLRQEFPGLDASAGASAIWFVFSDGRETCSRAELIEALRKYQPGIRGGAAEKKESGVRPKGAAAAA